MSDDALMQAAAAYRCRFMCGENRVARPMTLVGIKDLRKRPELDGSVGKWMRRSDPDGIVSGTGHRDKRWDNAAPPDRMAGQIRLSNKENGRRLRDRRLRPASGHQGQWRNN
jgi:hypothetical protein